MLQPEHRERSDSGAGCSGRVDWGGMVSARGGLPDALRVAEWVGV